MTLKMVKTEQEAKKEDEKKDIKQKSKVSRLVLFFGTLRQLLVSHKKRGEREPSTEVALQINTHI